VLPGVPELLAGLQATPEASLGLATGNFREAARLKLGRFGLYDLFLAGGYADDSEDRAELVAVAIERLAEASGGHGPREVYVIGDTPLDIAAAQANGARSVAVATGFFTVDELAAAGAGGGRAAAGGGLSPVGRPEPPARRRSRGRQARRQRPSAHRR